VPNLTANGIRIEYESFGDRSSPPLLLIMGFGGQMILWDEEFCRRLAEEDLFVIRFDNRDVGLSSKLEGMTAPYTIEDMAHDAIGLLDGLDIRRAHVCGASMGGMIAQTMAIRCPERVASLICMASTTGNPGVASASQSAVDPRATAPITVPRERESYVEHTARGMRELAGRIAVFDEERARRVAAALYDRCFCPEGMARQLRALLASGNRRPALAKLTLPTLVIHGDCDPLVPVEHGRDTAEAVPGAELLIIEGMGHELPPAAWPAVVAAIVARVKTTPSGGVRD
jgi:pimeloyl-ACP methyl ester carboxylesterase